MSKHTPGPWTALKAPHGPIDIFDARGWDIVTIYGGGVEAESKEANARLIAAAPDLLAVAKECIDLAKLAESLCGCRGDDDYVWGIQERLEAAIAKAEGRA